MYLSQVVAQRLALVTEALRRKSQEFLGVARRESAPPGLERAPRRNPPLWGGGWKERRRLLTSNSSFASAKNAVRTVRNP